MKKKTTYEEREVALKGLESAGLIRKTGIIRGGEPEYEAILERTHTRLTQRRLARLLLGEDDWATSD